jgi:hypothetical protein
MQDDLEVSFVDDDMVVVPAQDDEFVLVGTPALRPGGEMVDLEPVAALTAVPGTGEPRLSQKGSFQGWWSGSFPTSVVEEPA